MLYEEKNADAEYMNGTYPRGQRPLQQPMRRRLTRPKGDVHLKEGRDQRGQTPEDGEALVRFSCWRNQPSWQRVPLFRSSLAVVVAARTVEKIQI